MEDKTDLRLTLTLDGSGLWGARAQQVSGVLRFVHATERYAEGRFYLDHQIDGMPYTDQGFIEDLQQQLRSRGFKNHQQIDFSEAGMQDDKYVSMDASAALAHEVGETHDVRIESHDQTWTPVIDFRSKRDKVIDEIDAILDRMLQCL